MRTICCTCGLALARNIVFAACIAAPAVALSAVDRPNVLVILTDDQGWGDLSFNGNTNIATPRIDALASAGASFDRFFVSPVCSPTRAEFLTGRYFPRGGVWGVTLGGERLDLDERTIADVFREAGYATGCFGKWHNGTQYPYHPRGRGFEEFYGYTSGHWGDYFDPPLDHDGRIVRGKGFLTDDLTGRAMDFVDRCHEQGKPFFCYVPLNTPHTPAQVPDQFYSKFANAELKLRGGAGEHLAKTRAVLAMCENIDFNVGRLLDKLDALRIANDTIVVYFHDNGPNGVRWNGGMKGVKGSTDEGGVRSPLFMRWPARIRAGTKVKEIAATIDLLPTLADLARVPLAGQKSDPKLKPLDGMSLMPLLDGETHWPERLVFSHWNRKTSVRSQRHRLDAAGNLYDMTQDPSQTRDVASESPEIAARLREAVAHWRKDVLGELQAGPADSRPIPVGYPAFPATQLPARDGVPHGNVRRSASAPNCSFFTNWVTADDRMTWEIQVESAGSYEAIVYYTCAAGDVGSTISLSLGASAVETKITTPHDPPLYGKEHDRFPRESESLVKDFAPLKLGKLELKPGRGTLTLRAVNVAGRHVMDVQMIALELQR
jgi:arylsulfatase A-like enzyme